MSDPYAATAGAYDLLNAPWRSAQVAALERLRPLLRPDAGPILDVGAGSGLNTAWVLQNLPGSQVVALEPSPAMRALSLSRIAGHPDWYERVTVRPEDFFAATLPPRLGGAILLGVLGHFDAGERAAVFAELADRLPDGGAALIDLQQPERPEAVPAATMASSRVGELEYRLIGEAIPAGGDRLQWRMTYLGLDGERVLTEETTEHIYHHPAPAVVADEAAAVGLGMERLADTTYWLLRRA
ncbi:class I SAM-dependent methyltransferase [Micropruina sp.]|uniref:class I SAM-dependent methyltransferase n=1 Tax=Micropruina sp. TaxID=2737536 RepID=UPI0039E5E3E0